MRAVRTILGGGPLRLLIVILAAAVALTALPSCGDSPSDDGPPADPRGNRKPRRTKKKAQAEVVNEPIVHVAQENWSKLEPYFQRFQQEPASSRRDPYRNYITAHVALPEPPEEPAVEAETDPNGVTDPLAFQDPLEVDPETSDDPVAEAPRSPLQRYAAEEYKLLLIQSGTSVPKALVEDPIGNTWIVRRDTPFGNRGGVVESITQYAVIVREPDAENPIEKTLRPLIFERAPEIRASLRSDFLGAERLTGPPL